MCVASHHSTYFCFNKSQNKREYILFTRQTLKNALRLAGEQYILSLIRPSSQKKEHSVRFFPLQSPAPYATINPTEQSVRFFGNILRIYIYI